jgi:hydroxymethylbilane synthase
LRDNGHDVEIVEVVTEGDRSAAALQHIGGTGVFVAELREQLRRGDVDLAVHSLKDLPTAPAGDLVVAAIPLRADPRDALVTRDGARLDQLPDGARVGTGSPRRAAQLRGLGLGLDVVPIRGNVDTRLRKVADGEYDAVVVAAAGLARLGRLDEASELLDPGQLLPAPGQGALAVECRAADTELATALGKLLDDPVSRAAVTAERTLLAALEAGCTAPVGALADVGIDESGNEELYLRAVVVAVDGSRAVRLSTTGPLADGERLGQRLAADLLDAGAAGLIGETNP